MSVADVLWHECGGISSASRLRAARLMPTGVAGEGGLWRSAMLHGEAKVGDYLQGIVDARSRTACPGVTHTLTEDLETVDRALRETSTAFDMSRFGEPLRCPACGGGDVRSRFEQRRSADEGATEIKTCGNERCGRSWR